VQRGGRSGHELGTWEEGLAAGRSNDPSTHRNFVVYHCWRFALFGLGVAHLHLISVVF